jgi:Uncharacterized conserved protein (COG2071)
MRLPAIHGVIRRRILVNYRVDPAVMRSLLPSRFAPKLQDGHAIAGICLIRLEAIRPRPLPAFLGLSSENAAHRVAVTWETGAGKTQEGVFIPRRDTNSMVNHLGGGRLFPGEHHRAAFTVREATGAIDLRVQSRDGVVSLRVRGSPGGGMPAASCFPTLRAASDFFEPGSLGYSVTGQAGRLDGIELRTHGWSVEPFRIEELHSSYFDDRARFPEGSVEFDCALIMRHVPHEWRRADDLRA